MFGDAPRAPALGAEGGDWPAANVRDRSGSIAVLAFTLAAYVALALGYATLTPIWQNPDEPAHYNYIAFVAETGGLPTLQPGDWDSALLERLKSGQPAPGRLGRLDPVRGLAAAALLPRRGAALPPRTHGRSRGPGLPIARLRHRHRRAHARRRVFAAREVLPRHLAVAVPLAIVGIPMFTAVSAAISADPLANLLAAGLLLVLVRRVRGDRSDAGWRWAIAAGVLLGLGLLTKLALAIFFPLALAVLLVGASRPIREGALLLGATGLVVLPWLVHQVTTYGWADPLATSRHAAVVLDQPRFPGLSLTYLADFLTITFHSFWAQFGWMGVVAPARLYWAYGLLLVIALGGLVVERRRLSDEPAWRLVLATVGAAVLGYIAYNLTFEQFQGRYLFTALVPIAMLLVLGWAGWLPRRAPGLGPRPDRHGPGRAECVRAAAGARARFRANWLDF